MTEWFSIRLAVSLVVALAGLTPAPAGGVRSELSAYAIIDLWLGEASALSAEAWQLGGLARRDRLRALIHEYSRAA